MVDCGLGYVHGNHQSWYFISRTKLSLSNMCSCHPVPYCMIVFPCSSGDTCLSPTVTQEVYTTTDSTVSIESIVLAEFTVNCKNGLKVCLQWVLMTVHSSLSHHQHVFIPLNVPSVGSESLCWIWRQNCSSQPYLRVKQIPGMSLFLMMYICTLPLLWHHWSHQLKIESIVLLSTVTEYSWCKLTLFCHDL